MEITLTPELEAALREQAQLVESPLREWRKQCCRNGCSPSCHWSNPVTTGSDGFLKQLSAAAYRSLTQP